MSGERSLSPLEVGDADAMAQAPYRYQDALAAAGATEAEYPTIARGQQLPGDILIASGYLEDSVRNDIQFKMLESKVQLMESISSVESLAFRFRGSTLTSADDANYDMIRQAYQAIGQGDFLK